MIQTVESLRPFTFRDNSVEQVQDDLELVRQGKMSYGDFRAAREPRFDRTGRVMNPVMVQVHDRFGRLKAQRFTFNTRTNDGIDWQARAMGGGPNSATLAALGFTQGATANIAITAPTGTTAGILTDTNAGITTSTAALNQFIGCTLVYMDNTTPRIAHIVGNSASAASNVKWYFDNWLQADSLTAGLSAPAANKPYFIMAGSPTLYMGLTTDATAVAATDHLLTSEITDANGLKRVYAMTASNYSHTAGAASYVMKQLFNATGTYTAVQKCGMFTGLSFPNDAASDLANVGKGGGLMVFENTFSSVNLISGDTLTVTWTVNY